MKFSNIFKKTLCITQAGGLFFSCQGLGVNAGKFSETTLGKILPNLATALEQLQILKKLVCAGVLDGDYPMYDEKGSEKTGEKISKEQNFSNLLEGLEKVLFECFGALKKLGLEFDESEYLAACKKDPNLKTRKDFCLKKIKDVGNKDFDEKDYHKIQNALSPVQLNTRIDLKLNSRLDKIFDVINESLDNSSKSIKVSDLMESIKKGDVSYAKVDEVLESFRIVENNVSDFSKFSKVVDFLEVLAGKWENTEFFPFLENQNFISSDENKKYVLEVFLKFYKGQKNIKDVSQVDAEEKLEEIKNKLYKCGVKAYCLIFLANRGVFINEHNIVTPFPLKIGTSSSKQFTVGAFFEFLDDIFSSAVWKYFDCTAENSLECENIEEENNKITDVDGFLEIIKTLEKFMDEVFNIFSMALLFTPDIAKDEIGRHIATSIIFELIINKALRNEKNENISACIRAYFENCEGRRHWYNNLGELGGKVPSFLKEYTIPSFESNTEKVKYLENLLKEFKNFFFGQVFGGKIDFKNEIIAAFCDFYCKFFSVYDWRNLIYIRMFLQRFEKEFKYKREAVWNKDGTFNRCKVVPVDEHTMCIDDKRDMELFHTIYSFMNNRYSEKTFWEQVKQTIDVNGTPIDYYLVDQGEVLKILLTSTKDTIKNYCTFSSLKDYLNNFKKNTKIKDAPVLNSDDESIFCGNDSFGKSMLRVLDEIKRGKMEKQALVEYSLGRFPFERVSGDDLKYIGDIYKKVNVTEVEKINKEEMREVELMNYIDTYLAWQKHVRQKVSLPKVYDTFLSMMNHIATEC